MKGLRTLACSRPTWLAMTSVSALNWKLASTRMQKIKAEGCQARRSQALEADLPFSRLA
jgi:hypothetical protein